MHHHLTCSSFNSPSIAMAPPPLDEQEEEIEVDQETISLWGYLVQCGIDVSAVVAVRLKKAAEAAAAAHADNGDDPNDDDDDVLIPTREPGSKGSTDLSAAAQQVGLAPPVGNKLVDPLQLTMAPDVMNLNLPPPPESQQAPPISDNTWSGMGTANPFERPLLARVGRNDPHFGPFILESSEVAMEYDLQQQREADNKRRVDVGEELPAAKRERRRYRWPAKTVANINRKIEQLKKEAIHDPAHRRPLLVIEAEIDKLQAHKEEIHAMVSSQQEDGQGSSRAPPPPPPPPPSSGSSSS